MGLPLPKFSCSLNVQGSSCFGLAGGKREREQDVEHVASTCSSRAKSEMVAFETLLNSYHHGITMT